MLRRLPLHPRIVPAGFRLTAASAACALLFPAIPAHAASVGGNAALTTDYVWRGSSQSDGHPTAQAGFKVTGASGLYGQLWGSGVDFPAVNDADTELDLVVGWSGELADDWTIDVAATHYRYPSTGTDLDWTELGATLTWRDTLWLQVAHSTDALAGGEAGTYALLGARWPLSDTLRLEAAAGHYRLDPASGYDDYTHAQVGAAWTFKAPFEMRLTLHDTDSAAERVFGDGGGSRVDAALFAAF